MDKADVDETNSTASIKNISEVFEKTQSAPETDALFFSKTAQRAAELEGYHSSTAASSYTKRLKRAFAVLIHIHRIRQGFAHGIVAKKNSEDQKQRRQRKQDSSVFLFSRHLHSHPFRRRAELRHFFCFRGGRQVLVQARTLTRRPRKRGKPRFVL